MESYNFTRCSSPVLIKNKYTGETLEVRCGCCKACALARRTRLSALCSDEEQLHNYCLFTTLTYNNDSIPLLQPIYKSHKDRKGYRFFNLTQRLKEYGSMPHFESDYYHKSKDWIDPLLQKFNLGGFIPYACKRDVQLFLKRLRKLLNRYTNEKIRYYAVSEYGPVHYRPHYHILFFYETEETNRYISRCIRIAWAYQQKFKKSTKKGVKTFYKTRPFGNVYNTLSRGKVTGYVASYVNASVSIPRFYTFAKFAKPFVLHSKNFACPISESYKKEIYKDDSFGFVDRIKQNNDKFVSQELSDTLKSKLFPRCRDFSSKSVKELLESYTIYRRASKEYQTYSVSKIAQSIYFELLQNLDNPFVKHFKFIQKCPDYLRLTNDVDKANLYVSRIMSDLYLSKHFYTFVCDKDETLEYDRIIQIQRFWNYIALRRLKLFYQKQQEYIDLYPNDVDYLPFMYINFYEYFAKHFNDFNNNQCRIYDDFEDYCMHQFKHIFNTDGNLNIKFKPNMKSHYMYRVLEYDTEVRFLRSIKHKKQNDLNNIFNDL